MRKSLALLLLSFFAMVGIANANLITNGDFETGDLTGWDASFIPGGSFVDNIPGYGYAAKLDDPTSLGYESISQSLYVSGLSEVLVSFDYLFTGTDASDVDETVTTWLGSWQDDPDSFGATLSFANGTGSHWLIGNYTTWTDNELVNITSNDPLFGTILHFEQLIDLTGIIDTNPNLVLNFGLWETFNDDTYVYLDNAYVGAAPVPEPATLLLLGSGIAGLAFYRRKRK